MANLPTDGGSEGVWAALYNAFLLVGHSAGGVNLGFPYIRLHDSKATTTDGGTFTSGAWRKRTVTKDIDTGANVAVTASVIVLAAGTYDCNIVCPGFRCDRHQARLRNTTAGTTILVSTNIASDSGTSSSAPAIIKGRFTITGSQNLEIQHRCGTTRNADGFGESNSFGENEIYTIAEFWKVG